MYEPTQTIVLQYNTTAAAHVAGQQGYKYQTLHTIGGFLSAYSTFIVGNLTRQQARVQSIRALFLCNNADVSPATHFLLFFWRHPFYPFVTLISTAWRTVISPRITTFKWTFLGVHFGENFTFSFCLLAMHILIERYPVQQFILYDVWNV